MDVIIGTISVVLFTLLIFGGTISIVLGTVNLIRHFFTTWHDCYCVCRRCLDQRLKEKIQREEWRRQTKAQDEAIEELYGKKW